MAEEAEAHAEAREAEIDGSPELIGAGERNVFNNDRLREELSAFLSWLRRPPYQICLASTGYAGETIEYGNVDELLDEYVTKYR